MKNRTKERPKYHMTKVGGRWMASIDFYTNDLWVSHSWDINFDETKPQSVSIYRHKNGKILWDAKID